MEPPQYKPIPEDRRRKYSSREEDNQRVVRGDSRYKRESLLKLREIRMLIAVALTAGLVAAVFAILR